MLYACQDYDFDLEWGCVRYRAAGNPRALWMARALHAAALLPWSGCIFVTRLGPIALTGVIATAGLLSYQHRLVRANDLGRLNAAFFTTNAFVSVILLVTFGSAIFFHS